MLTNYKKKIHKKCISINLTDKEKSDSQGNRAVSFAYNNLQSDLTQPTEYKLNRIQSYGYRGRIFSVENSEVKLLISCLAHTKMVERSTKKKIHYIISFSNDINTQSGSRVAAKKIQHFSSKLSSWQ